MSDRATFLRLLNELVSHQAKPSQVIALWDEAVGELADDNARLQSELTAEKEKNRWIPVSEQPNHSNAVLFADFKSAIEYECGIPTVIGFFFEGKMQLRTGAGIIPTHYKDCINVAEGELIRLTSLDNHAVPATQVSTDVKSESTLKSSTGGTQFHGEDTCSQSKS